MILSDRVCLMNNARIEQLGTPDELYFRPRSVFAADFLGESNILVATVLGVEGEWATLRAASADGVIVRAPAEPGLAVGERVRFMVRPENVALLGPGESADNEATAALEEVILVGGVTKHYARLPDGTTVSATSLTGGPLRAVEHGVAVRLGWTRERTVILRENGTARR